MAFIMHPSIAIKKLQAGDDSRLRDDVAAQMRLNLKQRNADAAAKRPHLHVSMKHI